MANIRLENATSDPTPASRHDFTFITLPGIGGSGERHWQTAWERSDLSIRRFQPSDWDKPELEDWLVALERVVKASTSPPILIAHSLSCLLVAHWAARFSSPIAGAFLVALPDPDGKAFPSDALSFRATPTGALRFPSVVVVSSDDPFGTQTYAESRAREWNSRGVCIGAAGHINESSNLGDWMMGKSILDEFIESLECARRSL